MRAAAMVSIGGSPRSEELESSHTDKFAAANIRCLVQFYSFGGVWLRFR